MSIIKSVDYFESLIKRNQNFTFSSASVQLRVRLRGCLKKIDKNAFYIVQVVISLYGNLKYSDFQQYLVWLGLISQS